VLGISPPAIQFTASTVRSKRSGGAHHARRPWPEVNEPTLGGCHKQPVGVGFFYGVVDRWPGRFECANRSFLVEYASVCTAVFEAMAAGGQRLAEAGGELARKAEGHAADARGLAASVAFHELHSVLSTAIITPGQTGADSIGTPHSSLGFPNEFMTLNCHSSSDGILIIFEYALLCAFQWRSKDWNTRL